jgi:hypothetical protein
MRDEGNFETIGNLNTDCRTQAEERPPRQWIGHGMANYLKSKIYGDDDAGAHPVGQLENRSGWAKVGAIAAASAVLGGLAAAWFYRKTLSQLREAEDEIADSDSGITEDETVEDF